MVSMSPRDRAGEVANLLARRRIGMTSYELSKIFGVRPQTVTNNLLRHGEKFGVKHETVQHRNNNFKRIWSYEMGKGIEYTIEVKSGRIQVHGSRLKGSRLTYQGGGINVYTKGKVKDVKDAVNYHAMQIALDHDVRLIDFRYV